MKPLNKLRASLLSASLAVSGILVCSMAVAAEPAPVQSSTWSAWGGEVGVRWNRELLQALGLELATPTQKLDGLSYREHERLKYAVPARWNSTHAMATCRKSPAARCRPAAAT